MKRTLLSSVASAALLALLVPGRLPAPEPVSPAEPARNGDGGQEAAAHGTVAGQVVGPAGEPVPAVTVVLQGEGVVKVEVTGLDGTFQFTGLELGEYKVEAALGSDATSETVDLTATGFAGVRFILGGPISPGEPSGGDAGEAGTGSADTPRSPYYHSGAAGVYAAWDKLETAVTAFVDCSRSWWVAHAREATDQADTACAEERTAVDRQMGELIEVLDAAATAEAG